MLVLLIVLFIVVPIVELFVIIQVGGAIGVLPTIALLIADSVLGSMLMRSQGRTAWRRFNAALAEGRMPHREVLDGVLVIFGGAFLLTPGFLTDILGAILLLPPTRALVRGVVARRLLPRVVVTGLGGIAGAPGHGGPARRRPTDAGDGDADPTAGARPSPRAPTGPRPRSTRPGCRDRHRRGRRAVRAGRRRLLGRRHGRVRRRARRPLRDRPAPAPPGGGRRA